MRALTTEEHYELDNSNPYPTFKFHFNIVVPPTSVLPKSRPDCLGIFLLSKVLSTYGMV